MAALVKAGRVAIGFEPEAAASTDVGPVELDAGAGCEPKPAEPERMPEPFLSPAWRHALRVYLVVRIVASLAAVVGLAGIPPNSFTLPGTYQRPQYSPLADAVLGVWEHGDSLWYVYIARDGYQAESEGLAFLPLYPMLMRAVHTVTGLPYLLSGILISNACFIVALYLLYGLCERDGGEGTARRAVWFMALFPGSFFMITVYTESLYVMLALAAFTAARQRRWVWAALAAALMGATRNLGVLMAVPLALEMMRQAWDARCAWRDDPERAEREGVRGPGWAAPLTLLLVPSGTCLVALYHYFWVNDALAFFHRQSYWQRQFMLPWQTLYEGVHQAFLYCGAPPGGVYVLEAWAVLLTLAMGILAWFRLRPSYAVFIWLSLLPPLCSPYTGRMLISCMRYVSVAFPCYMVLAGLVRDEDVERGILAVFTALYGLSIGLYVANQWMF